MGESNNETDLGKTKTDLGKTKPTSEKRKPSRAWHSVRCRSLAARGRAPRPPPTPAALRGTSGRLPGNLRPPSGESRTFSPPPSAAAGRGLHQAPGSGTGLARRTATPGWIFGPISGPISESISVTLTTELHFFSATPCPLSGAREPNFRADFQAALHRRRPAGRRVGRRERIAGGSEPGAYRGRERPRFAHTASFSRAHQLFPRESFGGGARQHVPRGREFQLPSGPGHHVLTRAGGAKGTRSAAGQEGGGIRRTEPCGRARRSESVSGSRQDPWREGGGNGFTYIHSPPPRGAGAGSGEADECVWEDVRRVSGRPTGWARRFGDADSGERRRWPRPRPRPGERR